MSAYYESDRDSNILANWLTMVKQLRADHAYEEWEIDSRDLYIAALQLIAATEVLGKKSRDLA